MAVQWFIPRFVLLQKHKRSWNGWKLRMLRGRRGVGGWVDTARQNCISLEYLQLQPKPVLLSEHSHVRDLDPRLVTIHDWLRSMEEIQHAYHDQRHKNQAQMFF